MSWHDMDAILDERFAADLEMAQLEAEGRRIGRAIERSRRLREAGDLDGAAAACPHTWTGPTDSGGAVQCYHCGSEMHADDHRSVTRPCVHPVTT